MQGERQGHVRLTKPEFVKEALERGGPEGKVPLDNVKASIRLVADEEEKNFYHRVRLYQQS